MWLQYAISDNGELIYIEHTPRGRTGLHCPYCGGLLTAKKGQIKAPHFAHTGETCRQVDRDQDAIELPAYDNFNLHLPPKVLKALRGFPDVHYSNEFNLLEHHNLAKLNTWNRSHLGGTWELTHKGKIPRGELSFMLFNDFQETLFVEKYQQLEEVAAEAFAKPQYEARLAAIEAEARPMLDPSGHFPARPEHSRSLSELNDELWAVRGKLKAITMDLETALTDLRLYRAQWRRILSLTLYFLEINGGELYKIGVTNRDVHARIEEIRSDLAPHLGTVQIKLIGTWEHRGNVELYFKHRYGQFNHPLGDLTEYYQFADPKDVIRDLRRMKAKELSDLEQAVLSGQPPAIEERIRLEAIEQKRRIAIRRGMAKAAARGQSVGRPSQSDEDFLTRYANVKEALETGLSLRKVATRTGVAVNTVRKVQRLTGSKSEA